MHNRFEIARRQSVPGVRDGSAGLAGAGGHHLIRVDPGEVEVDVSPEQVVQQLTQRLADPGLGAAERCRLRVLRLVAAIIDDPNGDHDAAIDEIVDDWAPGPTGDSSEIELELPGQGGAFGPLTLDAIDGGADRIDVVVSPGDLPVSVSVGVVVRNGRIMLDTSRVPETLFGADLTSLHARAHHLVTAHNRRRGGLRPLPDGMAAMEADVRAVIAELEAAGRPVTAGAIRVEYGGTKGWDPETDSMDPEMEEVFRRLDLPGAHPPPEPLPVLGAVGSDGVSNTADLPLVPWTPGTMAIEDRPTVVLSSRPGATTEWTVTIRRRDQEPVTLQIDPRFVRSNGDVDLHAVAGLLATRGIEVEPISRMVTLWAGLDLNLSTTRRGREPLGQARYIEPQPMVAVRSEYMWWTVFVDTGDPDTSFEERVDRRHVNGDLDLDLVSLAEELRDHGIAVDSPSERLLARPQPSRGSVPPESNWTVLPGTRHLAAPADDASPSGEPDSSPADDADGTTWLHDLLNSGKAKLVVGGAGGMLLLGIIVPQLLGDGGVPADLPTTTITDPGSAAVAPTTAAPTSTTADDTPEVPTVDLEPPAGYVAPTLSFAPDGPPTRVADRGSLWGTNTWDTVTSVGKRIGNVQSTPPATVYPAGASFEAEFVIYADCDGAGNCTYRIPRGTTTNGEQDYVPLDLDGLTLTGPGDGIIDGCRGESGVEFVVSDLTLVGARLVPTYMTGRRWFEEDCSSYTRSIENTYHAHYVDRPSLTPSP